MGKRSKSIKKTQKVRQVSELRKQQEMIQEDIQKFLHEEEYSEVINKLAELIQQKCYHEESMYAGAYSYYKLGDYKRATDWVNNTLAYAPQHLAVRILLVRLCLQDNRIDEALQVAEYVLEHGKGFLKDNHLSELREILTPYAEMGAITETSDYPAVRRLLHLEAGDAAVTQAADSDVGMSNAKDSCGQVLASAKPLLEKMRMLNTFAAGYYVSDNKEAAEYLLAEALKLDCGHQGTLRNMVMLQIAKGDKDRAQEFMSMMDMPDFVLLDCLQRS